MQFVTGPGWKQDQCSDARLRKAPCSVQMVIIQPKEAASLTRLIHKAAFAIITLLPLRFLTSPSPPPGSSPPHLGTFVTKLGHPADVFYSSLLSTAKGQGAASRGRPGPEDESGEGFAGGENNQRTTPVTCCSRRTGSSLSEVCLISHSSKKLAPRNFPPPVQPVQPLLSRCDRPTEESSAPSQAICSGKDSGTALTAALTC